MVEVCVEEGNFRDLLHNILLTFSIWSHRHTEGLASPVRHLAHQISHLFSAEEFVYLEGFLWVHGSEVGDAVLDVETESGTPFKCCLEIIGNYFTDLGICHVTFSDSFHLWSNTGQLALIAHETCDIALLVPDKKVPVRGSSLFNSSGEILETVNGPLANGSLYLDHFCF